MTETVKDEPIIICREVHKWFGNFHVLRGISMEVSVGEVIVICGPSGSGKSTFIRTINRLEEHQQGDIIVDGIELTHDVRNIEKIRNAARKRHTGPRHQNSANNQEDQRISGYARKLVAVLASRVLGNIAADCRSYAKVDQPVIPDEGTNQSPRAVASYPKASDDVRGKQQADPCIQCQRGPVTEGVQRERGPSVKRRSQFSPIR